MSTNGPSTPAAPEPERPNRDWNRCTQTPDGKHVPQQGPHDFGLPRGWMNVECAACGITTGVPLPTEIEWA